MSKWTCFTPLSFAMDANSRSLAIQRSVAQAVCSSAASLRPMAPTHEECLLAEPGAACVSNSLSSQSLEAFGARSASAQACNLVGDACRDAPRSESRSHVDAPVRLSELTSKKSTGAVHFKSHTSGRPLLAESRQDLLLRSSAPSLPMLGVKP